MAKSALKWADEGEHCDSCCHTFYNHLTCSFHKCVAKEPYN